ncbi:hypothetical protein AAG570_004845 [Ranatra chinensis]|uniref:Endonuclease/exonuclease/phosphatase domain-containing protein n=1 Tax=Ranatra chinensis TaxID=642074 RepID=A0ABD0Y0C0_9HEMI
MKQGANMALTAIQVYAPTAGGNEEEYDRYYEQLSETLLKWEGNSINYIVLMGDFNSKRYKRKADEEQVDEMEAPTSQLNTSTVGARTDSISLCLWFYFQIYQLFPAREETVIKKEKNVDLRIVPSPGQSSASRRSFHNCTKFLWDISTTSKLPPIHRNGGKLAHQFWFSSYPAPGPGRSSSDEEKKKEQQQQQQQAAQAAAEQQHRDQQHRDQQQLREQQQQQQQSRSAATPQSAQPPHLFKPPHRQLSLSTKILGVPIVVRKRSRLHFASAQHYLLLECDTLP